MKKADSFIDLNPFQYSNHLNNPVEINKLIRLPTKIILVGFDSFMSDFFCFFCDH